jgi:hypothetical protein
MDPDAYFAEVEAEAVAIAEEDLRWLIERIRREEETGIDLRSVTGPSVEVSPELAARAGIPAEKASSKLGKGILGLLSRFH